MWGINHLWWCSTHSLHTPHKFLTAKSCRESWGEIDICIGKTTAVFVVNLCFLKRAREKGFVPADPSELGKLLNFARLHTTNLSLYTDDNTGSHHAPENCLLGDGCARDNFFSSSSFFFFPVPFVCFACFGHAWHVCLIQACDTYKINNPWQFAGLVHYLWMSALSSAILIRVPFFKSVHISWGRFLNIHVKRALWYKVSPAFFFCGVILSERFAPPILNRVKMLCWCSRGKLAGSL